MSSPWQQHSVIYQIDEEGKPTWRPSLLISFISNPFNRVCSKYLFFEIRYKDSQMISSKLASCLISKT